MAKRESVFLTLLALLAVPLVTGACSDNGTEPKPKEEPVPTSYTYQVLNSYPHADTAWTQGFEYDNGVFLEGTGQTGRSYVWRAEIATGNVIKQHLLDNPYFGEGVTRLGSKIFQLTWLDHICFVYNEADLASGGPLFGTSQGITAIDTLDYGGQGWGLTNNGSEIIMSNGSSLIRHRDPDDFSIIREYQVKDRGRAIDEINELELINGMVYANIWQTDSIYVFDPADGKVTAWIDLAGLPLPADQNPNQNVLNGIAYDATGDRLFVTGKYWSKVYEIQLVPAANP